MHSIKQMPDISKIIAKLNSALGEMYSHQLIYSIYGVLNFEKCKFMEETRNIIFSVRINRELTKNL